MDSPIAVLSVATKAVIPDNVGSAAGLVPGWSWLNDAFSVGLAV